MATISYVMAAAFAMIVFSSLANLIVVQYASGVVQAALDEGVRDGSSAGAHRCEARAQEFLDSALGGAYGDGVVVSCREEGPFVVAAASATFPGYAPFVPDLSFDFEATAAVERPVP